MSVGFLNAHTPSAQRDVYSIRVQSPAFHKTALEGSWVVTSTVSKVINAYNESYPTSNPTNKSGL